MSFWGAIKGMFSGAAEKAQSAGTTLMLGALGYGSATKASRKAYATEGYDANAVVHRCVGLIARSVASCPVRVLQGEEDAPPNHPLRALLEKPNPMQSGEAFIETIVAFNRIFGNSFVEKLTVNSGEPKELWPWPAYAMKVKRSKDAPIPVAYVFNQDGATKMWEVDRVTGESDMLSWRTFNPTDPLVGLSPIEAAAFEVDQHNQAGKWNYATLKNAAMPGGALVSETDLTSEQKRQIREALQTNNEGPSNARKTMILSGGLKWLQIMMTPQDMDWLKGRDAAARYIASVLGVPEQMVPIPGSQTFANYSEARLAFWEDTVLPLAGELYSELNRWLVAPVWDNTRLEVDIDAVPALEPRRKERWTSVQSADWLTPNEKREATGYEPYEERAGLEAADRLWIPAGMLPISEQAEPPEPGEPLPPGDEDDEEDDE